MDVVKNALIDHIADSIVHDIMVTDSEYNISMNMTKEDILDGVSSQIEDKFATLRDELFNAINTKVKNEIDV